MNENENLKLFKLILKQEDNVFYEGVIDANLFHPLVRNYVDIKSLMKSWMGRLQKTLSMNKQNNYYHKRGSKNELNIMKYYTDYCKYIKKRYLDNIEYSPNSETNVIDDDLTIKGVKFKLGFYINNNPIIEREFFVDYFNPASKWSNDLKELMDEFLTYELVEHIKSRDYENIWGDFDLINKGGFTIPQIREMSIHERNGHLRRFS